MEINLPDVVADVRAAFARYEVALHQNDVTTLNELFWRNDATVRYGVAEKLVGWDAIASYRLAYGRRIDRSLTRTIITTYGREYATSMTEYVETGRESQIGRQSQAWLRTGSGWRIVAAHVSLIAVEAKACTSDIE